ncbi:hypothetical protein AB9P05_11770 [Roseivirga sp. BDSF3-8]|uniref:hypothetical protein n=1 Tax=Roseivirga sp. BDSF3-8 TaxID=3241598 RepID=UPI003531CC28
MKKNLLVLICTTTMLWSCHKEEIGHPAGEITNHEISATSDPVGGQFVEYSIPESESEAAGSVASFEQVLEAYSSGELNEEDVLSVNPAYAEWVLEATFNKAHAHQTQEEYYSEPDALSVSVNLPVINEGEKFYVNGYQLAVAYQELSAMAVEGGFEIAPNSDLEIVSLEGGTMEVTLFLSRKWFNPFGPVALGPDDDYKAYVKTKCDGTGNINAADRLTKAHRSLVDFMAYPWYYNVKKYYIRNNKVSSPYYRDIFDYRLYYHAYDPFGRLGWYHAYNVSKTSFDDKFLGGASVSGVSGATQYAPGYCVDDTEMVSLNNDLKYVLSEVKKDIPNISSIRVWSDKQFNYSTISARTHHNLEFRGAFPVRVMGPSYEPANPILL